MVRWQLIALRKPVLLFGAIVLLTIPISAFAIDYQSPVIIYNPDPQEIDQFGNIVLLSGDNVFVSSPGDNTFAELGGAVFLFDINGTLLRTFTNPTPEPIEGFGHSISVSENKVLIGSLDSIGAQFAGAAYLFDINTGELLQTFLNPTPANNEVFGRAASISGDLVIIGVAGDNSFDPDPRVEGAAYLFNATTGELLHTFLNPDQEVVSFFGQSVSISDNKILIGSLDPSGVTNEGMVFLFDATTNELLHTFVNPDPPTNNSFGILVVLSGKNAFVSSVDIGGGQHDGVVHLFDATTGELVRTFENPEPTPSDDSDLFAVISAFDNKLLVGAPLDDNNADGAGIAYIFDITTGELLHTFVNPGPTEFEFFGASVSIFGNNVLIGAPADSTNGTQTGIAYFFLEDISQDINSPIITLIGFPVVNLEIDDIYVDVGATALDDVDGNITSKIVTVNPVNTSISGSYVVTYDVSDAAGNAAEQATRTVRVFTDIIDSDFNGNVDVDSGEIVLVTNGAEVNGNIKVDGGTLILENNCTVNGNVDSKNGGTIDMTNCTINGNVKTKDSQNISIENNTITGNIESENDETINIINNTIGGNVDVRNSQSIIVTGNTVNGNLMIQNTITSCTDTGNNVNGNLDGCP